MSDNRTTENIRRCLPLLLSPLLTAAVLLFVLHSRGFYPFGDKTIAWCDMNQQVVPLLCQFKDILDGKSGFLFSFKNASGMNFFGVFFFFLSSPFSFLTAFVEKKDMLLFANLLVLLKMMTCALTGSLYFVRSEEHKDLGVLPVTMLGFVYASCGYVMLFYQNVIWLDVMYLFPLLLIALERLHETGSPLMYIFVSAGIMTVNYYIGYMAVLFLLLAAGVYSIGGIRADSDRTAKTCAGFLYGSAAAALLSAAVWLPSFIQYLGSGRKTSLMENLRTSDMITDFTTAHPVITGSAALLFFAAADVKSKRRRTPEHKLWLAMAALLTIPVIFEPVNKMWHTGSYMAFPVRYAFMTVFLMVIAAAYFLGEKHELKSGIGGYLAASITSAAMVFVYAAVCRRYIEENIDELSEYTRSLGGSEGSFKALLKILVIGLICLSVMYVFYRKGMLIRNVFLIFVSAVTVLETAGYERIYMTTSGELSAATYALQRQVFDLSDRINDSGFYRVKTSGKIFDYNMIGAMGYNSIGHYTSLTNEDYMFTMKRLGYTSVWMEVGTCGGTELTDALLSVGYEIGHGGDEKQKLWSFGSYDLYPLEYRLDAGLVTPSRPDEDIPADLTRPEIQQYLFNTMFGEEKVICPYSPDEGRVSFIDGRYSFEMDEMLIYRIKVKGRQTLYLDCFDRLSNELSEPVYDSFSVNVNGRTVSRNYPYSKENGLLKLGSFEDQTVTIDLTALKDISCRSFGVFGLDTELIGEKISSAKTLALCEAKNGMTGSADLDKQSEVLLAVPYDSGFTLMVNGKKQPLNKALSCFMSFTLPAGHSDISIKFVPKGLKTGLMLTAAGGIMTLLCAVHIFRRKMQKNEISAGLAEHVSRYLLAGIGILVFVIIYLLPMLLDILLWKKE